MNNIKMEVRYYTQSGNTKKIADTIAEALDLKAFSIKTPINKKVDLLFLGASVYWGGINKNMKEFIDNMSAENIGRVAIFSTSAMKENAYTEIKKRIEKRGIKVEERDYYCKGSFKIFNKNKPDIEDLQRAANFAKSFL
ncbi:flavodoxin family protein [Clostridium felsineum]|uniref:Flavodoxin domain-containing protein n=1 Tax=Clostridium felsineum TaxID=36839 RepID=A0A1S8LAU9_9CLOT|nr:flavodoxin domain-containing protein [Clostridium felsineum]MCR3758117.1 flavodoxin [Clostridium felsineum]URZ01112.1 hypothetical protein CLAUR_011000 [Clostridium felsineum]URZ06142.1 hypothetical protein CLROS_014750 [Clostridium felsineum]URZ11177.1 hypothetical protein CROST_018940 [Clostridium felsineum]